MKLRKIHLENHKILGDLDLDFTNNKGEVHGTIMLAGENGTGKSLILDIIFQFSNLSLDSEKRNEKRKFEIELSELEMGILKGMPEMSNFLSNPIRGNIFNFEIDYSLGANWNQILITVQAVKKGVVTIPASFISRNEFQRVLKSIFSDVEINFTPNEINSVTSKNIDSDRHLSERSGKNLSTDITQLLIDIQNIDALELNEWVRKNPKTVVPAKIIDKRTKRFTDAFHSMFPSKKYKGIDTIKNRKEVIFEENGREMNISKLSSGEKQIVFRGGFLLKDIMSSRGALILIDEPEISLHPMWQLRIIPFFKKLFLENGVQTSQLIIATHSPFILHNTNRFDDKVIILKKDEDGKILILDTPEFYSWSGTQRIEKAFQIGHLLKPNIITVFLEGETDEKYFRKAMEVFNISSEGIQFKWIGRINESGNAENTGDTALNQALKFFLANSDMIPGNVILLYDSDTKKKDMKVENLEVRVMPIYQNEYYQIGIENLLKLPDDFNSEDYYSQEEKIDGYGAKSKIVKLDKTKLCNHICDELEKEKQLEFLVNIKSEIDKILTKVA